MKSYDETDHELDYKKDKFKSESFMDSFFFWITIILSILLYSLVILINKYLQ